MPNLLCFFVFCCIELLGSCRAEEVVVLGSRSMGRIINDEREGDNRLMTFRPVTVKFTEDYDDVTQPQLPKSPKPKPNLKPISHSSSSGKSKKPNIGGSSGIKSKQVVSGHAGKSANSMQNKVQFQDTNSLGKAKSSAVLKAQEIRSDLGLAYPSFVKSLVRSHVASCSWMGLPVQFCKIHLPDKDTMITLEDESGRHYDMKYIACKTGLSAGWRQFVASHKLIEGDVLVFQLVEPTKFKVYTIKANGLNQVDGALGLLYLDAYNNKRCGSDKDSEEIGTVMHTNTSRKRIKSLHSTVTQTKKTRISSPRSVQKPAEQSENDSEDVGSLAKNDSEDVGSEVMEDSKWSELMVEFKSIKDFENFYIVIDGMLLDSELSEDIRSKYYKLCCSQNEYLHENVIRGLNYKLLVGIIVELVNIADSIISSKVTNSREDFTAWEKSLKAFEFLGMNVGFLHGRLCQLASIAYEAEVPLDARRYRESRSERSAAQTGLWSVETKLVELQEACHRFGSAIKTLGSQAESYHAMYQQVVDAPW